MSLPPIARPPPALPTSRAVSPPAMAPPTIRPMPRMVSSRLLVGVARDPAPQLRHVAAHDVAGLVGDHADDLVGGLGLR